MINLDPNSSTSGRRVWVFRLSSGRAATPATRSGWLAKLLIPAALIALIPLGLLVVVGLWAVVAIGAGVIATTALLGAPLLRRLRAAHTGAGVPSGGHTLEGEARRVDVE
jgi:hypothetical protein